MPLLNRQIADLQCLYAPGLGLADKLYNFYAVWGD